MANPTEVKKWFYEGPIDPINALKYKLMNSKHRELYNLFRLKQQLTEQLEQIENKLNEVSPPILKELMENPNSPMHQWAWWEILDRRYPKWAEEFEKALGKEKADEIRNKYKSNKNYYLRIKFIHSRSDPK
jgi:hypothetical protein